MRSQRLAVVAAVLAVVVLVAASAAPAAAQEATLKIKVKPKSGYTLVDGRPLGQGNHTLRLPEGEHQVGIYRYGRKPHVETVTLTAGQTTNLEVRLESIPGTVSGPFSRIRLLVQPDDTAVFLNGRTPDFLVGCTGSTDGHFLVGQELLVPPGTHDIALALDGYTTYTTQVTVEANQRVEIRHVMQRGSGEQALPASAQSFKAEERLANLGPRPRDQGDGNSMKAAIAPVAAQFSADPTRVNCQDSSRLSWSSEGAARVEISGLGEVAPSGERLVAPTRTTTYRFTAAGPGGVRRESASVNVEKDIKASLSVSPTEIRYRRIGDRILEHGRATVTWSTSNATQVRLEPFGEVSLSGSRAIQPTPRQTSLGRVDETLTGMLTATNPCGGSVTLGPAGVSLRIVGSIEAVPEIVLASVFFPTDYPDERHPDLGLLRSQQPALARLAESFKDYLVYDPTARLRLEGHADERRSSEYNRELSERRAARVKQFLVDQGIPAANIDTQAFGEEQNLDRDTVQDLEEQNPSQGPEARVRSREVDWLAHNRRVDIVLRPSGQVSERYYPHSADDSRILWQVPKPSRRAVEENQ
ncbi:MAG: PEGA domain-containing protein [Terriglobia bacterium]